MTDKELIHKAVQGEIVGDGREQIEALLDASKGMRCICKFLVDQFAPVGDRWVFQNDKFPATKMKGENIDMALFNAMSACGLIEGEGNVYESN